MFQWKKVTSTLLVCLLISCSSDPKKEDEKEKKQKEKQIKPKNINKMPKGCSQFKPKEIAGIVLLFKMIINYD